MKLNDDDAVVVFTDGRPSLLRRDLIRDNMIMMRREWLSTDLQTVTAWTTASAIEQMRVYNNKMMPFGHYTSNK